MRLYGRFSIFIFWGYVFDYDLAYNWVGGIGRVLFDAFKRWEFCWIHPIQGDTRKTQERRSHLRLFVFLFLFFFLLFFSDLTQ